MSARILNKRQVRELTTLSDSTIWRKIRRGEFPARRKLSTNRVGWVEEEIIAWIEARMVVGQTAEHIS